MIRLTTFEMGGSLRAAFRPGIRYIPEVCRCMPIDVTDIAIQNTGISVKDYVKVSGRNFRVSYTNFPKREMSEEYLTIETYRPWIHWFSFLIPFFYRPYLERVAEIKRPKIGEVQGACRTLPEDRSDLGTVLRKLKETVPAIAVYRGPGKLDEAFELFYSKLAAKHDIQGYLAGLDAEIERRRTEAEREAARLKELEPVIQNS